MKYLIMCEGPNELEVIRMLLEHDKLIFTEDDLLNLVPYHARQIGNNAAVKAALNLYHGEVCVLRIGDKLNDDFFGTITELLILPEYQKQGIGSRLLQLAKENTPTMLYFGSQPGIEAFYEKNGCQKSLQSYMIERK